MLILVSKTTAKKARRLVPSLPFDRWQRMFVDNVLKGFAVIGQHRLQCE